MDELKKRLREIMLAQFDYDDEARIKANINEFVEVIDALIVKRIEAALAAQHDKQYYRR